MVSVDEKVGIPVALGRFSRGAAKIAISPFADPIGTMKGVMGALPTTLVGLINMPEEIIETAADTYYLGHDDWDIDGEDSGEALLPAIVYGGMVGWMAKTVYDATQVSEVSELATTGYVAAGCYIATNLLFSGGKWLNRRMDNPPPLPDYSIQRADE